MNRLFVHVVAAALLALCALPAQVNADGPAISPFRGMRKVDAGIEVQVLDDTWFALESVNGVDTATLLKDAERLARGRAWKRITEDLPALFDAMGVDYERRVDVVVRSLQTGEKQTFEAVEMTGENRRRVKEMNDGGKRRVLPILDAAFAEKLDARQAREDLDLFEQLLETRFAYRELRPVDLAARMAEARRDLDGGISTAALAARVEAVLQAFGDGHSRLRSGGPDNALWTPFLVQQVDGGHVAFLPDRSGFVSAEHPFVVAIDGVPLQRWLDAANARVTKGSAVMQRQKTERGLRELTTLRRALGLETRATVALTLRGPAGELEKELPVAARKPLFGAWPRRETGLLEDGAIGYLRIPTMDSGDAFLDGLDAAMQRFRGTKGLVIDVRGNGGGRRDALRRLAPYFLPKDGTPVVGNVASVLLETTEPARPDALADRYLYRADWDGWSDRQRQAIGAFLRGFEPSWKLPKGRFSPWHFLVLDRDDNPDAFRYDGDVVVLIDRGCFSATDIFAGAMQAIPGVTLVGEATAGGSGRARGYQLPNSGVRLQLSTMASFRPDGTLFEGHGVVPDVAVATRPGDLVGDGDAALEKALELLR